MYAKHYENPTMLSRVTAKKVGDVFVVVVLLLILVVVVVVSCCCYCCSCNTSTTTSPRRLQVARQSYILEVSHLHLCDWRRSLP